MDDNPLRPRSAYLKAGLFGLFFQSEQCFSLTAIQPEQCFQPISAKIQQAEWGLNDYNIKPHNQILGHKF